MSSQGHILQVPKVVLGLRIIQLLLAITILGLSAYVIEFYSFDGADLSLFTSIASMIIVIYNLVASIASPVIYNYWAVLGLDIFAVIFWLISFALLASETAGLHLYYYSDYDCYYGYCFRKRDVLGALAKRATTNFKTYRNSMAAASGLGGLSFLLFIATLAITAIYLHRHRTAGGHCMPGATGPEAGVHNESKPTELQPQQPVYQQQPIQQPVQQPVYQQQPVQYQQQPVQYAANPDQQVSAG